VQVDPPARLLAAPVDDYVADFLGFDRGIRRLSFFPASALELDGEPVVADGVTVADALARAKHSGLTWLRVTDPQRLPRGWVSTATLEELAPASTLAQAPLEAGGHTFTVGTDSIRAVLDATILSPSGYATGVDDEGRVVGVVPYDKLLIAIHASTSGEGGGAAGGAAGVGTAGEGGPAR
jgi:osmoprotectant transport system ATP-binding protein